jgi:hypothetical protein
MRLMREKGYTIGNLDATIIAQVIGRRGGQTDGLAGQCVSRSARQTDGQASI